MNRKYVVVAFLCLVGCLVAYWVGGALRSPTPGTVADPLERPGAGISGPVRGEFAIQRLSVLEHEKHSLVVRVVREGGGSVDGLTAVADRVEGLWSGRGAVTVIVDGLARFEGLGEGQFRVGVLPSGVSDVFESTLSTEVDGVLVLPATLRIEGRVVDEDGSGVGGAEICGWRPGQLQGRASVVAVSDALGRFTAILSCNPVELAADKDGFLFGPSVVCAPGSVPATSVRLELRRGGCGLAVEVVDGRQRPVVGAVLSVRRLDGGGSMPCISTGDDGVGHIRGITPGRLLVVCRAPGYCYASSMVDVSRGTTEVAIQLSFGGSVIGKVVDSQGDGVSHALVSCGEAGDPWFTSVRTGIEGEYYMYGLPARSLWIRASRRGLGSASRAVSIENESEPVLVDLELREGGALQAFVRDQDGVPLGGASVVVSTSASRLSPSSESGAESDWREFGVTTSSGEVVVVGCPDVAEVDVRVSAPLHRSWTGRHRLEEGPLSVELLNIEGELISVKGSVSDALGESAVGARVLISSKAMGGGRLVAVNRWGVYATRLLPGDYILQVEMAGRAQVLRRFSVSAGEGSRELEQVILEEGGRVRLEGPVVSAPRTVYALYDGNDEWVCAIPSVSQAESPEIPAGTYYGRVVSWTALDPDNVVRGDPLELYVAPGGVATWTVR